MAQQRAGMSRSIFARRFSEALGAAPVEYLLRWRKGRLSAERLCSQQRPARDPRIGERRAPLCAHQAADAEDLRPGGDTGFLRNAPRGQPTAVVTSVKQYLEL
jgi:hypothetical protein